MDRALGKEILSIVAKSVLESYKMTVKESLDVMFST
jgi:hypothetical protein